MSNEKSNGMKKLDPFERGVWIFAIMGDRDILAMVDGSDSLNLDKDLIEEDMKQDLLKNKCVCVNLTRKYMFSQIRFPIPETDRSGKRTNRLMPGIIPCVSSHSASLDFDNDFVTHASLNCLTFISEIGESDVQKLRESVLAADESSEMVRRMKKSNIVSAKGTIL